MNLPTCCRRIRPPAGLLAAAISIVLGPVVRGEPIQASFDFAKDPEWESHRSRTLPEPVPITRQAFGWSPTQHADGKQPGELGGWVQRSIRPASYAKVIPARSLNDRLSASG